jgi:hypothetical protein
MHSLIWMYKWMYIEANSTTLVSLVWARLIRSSLRLKNDMFLQGPLFKFWHLFLVSNFRITCLSYCNLIDVSTLNSTRWARSVLCYFLCFTTSSSVCPYDTLSTFLTSIFTLYFSLQYKVTFHNLKKQQLSCSMSYLFTLTRITAKYIWSDCKRNDDILKELKTEPVMGKILKHKNNWIQHVNRMQTDRIPKLLNNYKPRGRTDDDQWRDSWTTRPWTGQWMA